MRIFHSLLKVFSYVIFVHIEFYSARNRRFGYCLFNRITSLCRALIFLFECCRFFISTFISFTLVTIFCFYRFYWLVLVPSLNFTTSILYKPSICFPSTRRWLPTQLLLLDETLILPIFVFNTEVFLSLLFFCLNFFFIIIIVNSNPNSIFVLSWKHHLSGFKLLF